MLVFVLWLSSLPSKFFSVQCRTDKVIRKRSINGTTQWVQTEPRRMIVAVFLHARTSDVSATWFTARASRDYTVVLPWLTSTLLLFSSSNWYFKHHFTSWDIQPIRIDNKIQQSNSDHIPWSVTEISFIETICMHCLFASLKPLIRTKPL